MKDKNYQTVQQEFNWLIDKYRFTYSEFAGLVQIELLVKCRWWEKYRTKYITIYHGHIDPIAESVKFFTHAKGITAKTD